MHEEDDEGVIPVSYWHAARYERNQQDIVADRTEKLLGLLGKNGRTRLEEVIATHVTKTLRVPSPRVTRAVIHSLVGEIAADDEWYDFAVSSHKTDPEKYRFALIDAVGDLCNERKILHAGAANGRQ